MLQDNQFTREGIPDLPGAAFGGDTPVQKRGVFPRFFLESKRNNKGEIMSTEMVELLIAGDSKNAPIRVVTDTIRRDYAAHYTAFKRGLEGIADGIPLEEWAEILPDEVNHLKSMNVYSVEQLAEIPDTGAQQIMGGMQIRAKAKAYLDKRAGMLETDNAADIVRLEEQLKERDNVIAMMQQQIKDIADKSERADAILAENEALKAAPRRGRPRKE